MQLSDLLLNRRLYRDNAGVSQDSSLSANYGGDSSNSSGSTAPATNVAPGTVIQSALLQSSGSDDRVEINPDDSFRAYTDGNITTLIDKDGIASQFGTFQEIVAVDATITNAAITNLDVDVLNYRGTLQPVVFTGLVVGAFSIAVLPTNWTFTKNGTGDYTITFDPLDTPLDVFIEVQAISGHFRSSVSFSTFDFDVTWQETLYGSDTFPVVGGGGGNVTVSQVRLAPGEVPVDVSFTFAAYLYY